MNVVKMYNVALYNDGLNAVLQIQIRSDPVFLGHPNPDPEKYQIQFYTQKIARTAKGYPRTGYFRYLRALEYRILSNSSKLNNFQTSTTLP